MRKSKFSEHQIVRILKSVEGGQTVKDICREHGVSSADLVLEKLVHPEC